MGMNWMTLDQAEEAAERWSIKHTRTYTVIEATEETMSHRFFVKIVDQDIPPYRMGINAVVRNVFHAQTKADRRYYYPK